MRGELKISLPNRGRMFSAQRFHVAALAAGCCLAVAAETMYTNGELKVIRERQTFEQLLQNDRVIEL